MRRRSSTDPSPFESPLHPTLQAALGSLDVDLEEELARYRQLRGIQQKAAQRRNSRTQPGEPSQARIDPAYPLISGGEATAARHYLEPSRTPVPPSGSHLDSPNPDRPGGSPHYLAIAHQTPDQTIGLQHDSFWSEDPAHAGLTGESTHLTVPDALAPDDYLESSEQLLRSLDDPDLEESDDSRPPDTDGGILASLLTPLGIGSMLLLLISSATLGYLVTHPASFGLLTWGDRSRPSELADGSGDGLDIASPDLSASEFQDLNLDTLSTLPDESGTGQLPTPLSNATGSTAPITATPGVGVTPSAVTPAPMGPSLPASPPTTTVRATQGRPPARQAANRAARPQAPAPQAQPSTPAQATVSAPSVAPAPLPQPTQAAAPASSSPAPAPAASQPAAPTSNADDYYYVVTDYTGDRSLQQAREHVSGAYVRNFPEGARVQLGAFTDSGGAEELADNLRQQGVSVEIYQP